MRRLLTLFLALFILGCNGGGDNGSLSSSTARNPQLEQQAVQSLVDLYRTAVVQEDIDRLQALLYADGGLSDGVSFLDAMAETFRRRRITDVQLTDIAVQVAPEPLRVSFQETLNLADPTTLERRTQVRNTTFQLVFQEANGIGTVSIVAVTHEGPQFDVVTRGQVMAGIPARIAVTETTGTLAIADIEVEVPETGVTQRLTPAEDGWYGAFTPPMMRDPHPLHIRVQSARGAGIELSHRYRLRLPGEGVVERVPGTESGRLFAVVRTADGTVWSGGDGGGRLYRLAPGATTASLVGQLLADPAGRIEDLVVDSLGRLHAVVFAPQASGDIVVDQGVFCQTVNVFDPAYPLQVRDPQSGALQPSPSTRALAAGGGDVWLFGSDGGVVRVADNFRDGNCPEAGLEVRYAPVFRRQEDGLLSNTVPALVQSADGALWFGTAFGLTRWHDQQFTAVPFDPTLSFQGDVATLEAFFRDVAQALFAARPLTTVGVGEVSFVSAFGSPLVKADLIFSGVEDAQGRLWVGTLGGGIRRVEAHGGMWQDTLHLTRQEGLVSNMVLALAVEPDGAVWAATDEGVSRIREEDEQVVFTTFSALDGLALPVRDVVVGADGVAWLATDSGLFRIVSQGGRVQGMVRDTASQPVAGADVIVQDTPFRTVTDATGRFVLANLPRGTHYLRIDGHLATAGPFSETFRTIEVTGGEQKLETVVLVPLAPGVPVDPTQGGCVRFPVEPGAALCIPGGAMQFPAGVAPEVSLTLLPLDALPLALPAGLTVGAAAALQPAGATFTTPVPLTLPNQGQLAPGQIVVLLRLDEATLTYEQVGFGQVSDDGTVITTLTGGLSDMSPVVFAAAEVPGRLLKVSGDGQTGPVGTALPLPLVVRVTGALGTPVPGIPVTFTVTAGNATLSPTEPVVSDARGQASATLTLGPQTGEIRVTVTALGLVPVTFTATSIAGHGVQLKALPLPETATVHTALPLVVQVTDRSDNPLEGVDITFQVTEGNGSLSASQVPTDVCGEATTTLTLGAIAGPNHVQASTEGQTVGFTVIGLADRDHARLIQVSGNNQTGKVGEVLPEPLVVRLEDQFGNPVVGEEVTAEIVEGQGEFLSSNAAAQSGPAPPQTDGSPTAIVLTDAQGEARFVLRVGPSEEDIVVRVSALAQAVQFLAIIGAVDTPGFPLDLAVAGTVVYVADFFAGVQIIDVSDPTRPTLLDGLDLAGTEERLALANTQLYVGANAATEDGGPRLYVLDISMPRTPRKLGQVDLPAAVRNHRIKGVAVQHGFAYVVTGAATANSGSLQVIDVRQPHRPSVVGFVYALPGPPVDIAVTGDVAYVPAETAGLLIFDLSDPGNPQLLASLGDPDPFDNVETGFFSGITLTGDLAYVIETRCEPQCDSAEAQVENYFTVLDLHMPTAPQRRGVVQTRVSLSVIGVAPAIAVAGQFAYVVQSAFGLRAIDIGDPDAPRLIGKVVTPGQAVNVETRETLIYVTDQLFGLQVIQGPVELDDTDGDGVIDFFDAFPTDPAEFQDTDRDGIGDVADLDDDNDGFSDEEERRADPPTDPQDPLSFPLQLPPPDIDAIVVDAASSVSARERNGTPEAPYRSITEGLRVLHSGHAPQIRTLVVRAGIYSPLTTQEVFPLDFGGLSNLTIQGAGRDTTVIDALFRGEVVVFQYNTQIVLDGFTLSHGGDGLLINEATALTIRRNRIADNSFSGISLLIHVGTQNLIMENIIESNFVGIGLSDNAAATITDNILRNNRYVGIQIGYDSKAQIRGNTIRDNAVHGVLVVLDSSAELQDNTVQHNGINGIAILMDAAATITGNNVRVNGSDGIAIGYDSTAEITNNTVSGHLSRGIVVDNSAALIVANTVSTNIQAGIAIQSSSEATVRDNSITANRAGIHVVADASADLTGNTVTHNQYGIVVQSADATIQTSTATDNVAGVFIVGYAKAQLIANTIESNRWDGVRVQSNSVVTATDNTMSENGTDGIAVLLDSTAVIAGNDLMHNAGAGMRIDLGSTATILDNVISDNGEEGIVVVADSEAEITRNTVTHNTMDGIAVETNSSATITDNSSQDNGSHGIFVMRDSAATIVDNVLDGNGADGISIIDGATAAISGGVVSRNRGSGMHLSGASTATIGCAGDTIRVAQNGWAGLWVEDDGSLAQIDVSRVEFEDNARGDIMGPVVDCSPSR
jgi:parallel beta-helix repeat protein